MIYYYTRIVKVRDYSIERGDAGYILDYDLPELIIRARLFLNNVIGWEDYKEPEDVPYFKNRETKISIFTREGNSTVAILRIEEFDRVMQNFIEKQLVFKKN